MPLYEIWYSAQTEKSKFQVEKRLEKIRSNGYFGHTRDLGDGITEIKFNDGRLIYYTIIPVDKIVLLLGGNKNGQDGDIRKAKSILAQAKEKSKRK